MNETDQRQRLNTIQEQVDQFIDNCLRLRDQFRVRNIDYFTLSENIVKASNSLPAHVHPMIAAIAFEAPSLAEDYYSIDDKDAIWNRICQLVENYANNRWA